MRAMCALVATILSIGCSQLSAQWEAVSMAFGGGERNCIDGPGESLVSIRPSDGPWTLDVNLSNHTAAIEGRTIPIHAANCVRLGDWTIGSGHAGKSSFVTFRVRLSEPVSVMRWEIGAIGRDVSAGAKLAARYSIDGQTWKDACVYPAGSAEFVAPAAVIRFSKPTREFYFGWSATVPEGQNGFWDVGGTGKFTFGSSDTIHAGAVSDASQEALSISKTLQASRAIPETFFAIVTHVNDESTIHTLRDLGIRCVLVNFRWDALEFGKGEYAFDASRNDGRGNWCIDSADVGLKNGLDVLPLVGNAPTWAWGEHGTYPNDQSVAAFEEFSYQIATKYKGRIAYWVADNEPNMAVWGKRYVTFLKAFSHGIKRADPANKIVLAGFAGDEAAMLDAVYRHGGKDYFDILNSHSYTRPQSPEEGGFFQKIESLRHVMKKYGDDKPLWIGEIGWNGVDADMLEYCRKRSPSHLAYSGTEEEQARYLARTYLLAATVPWIERFYSFHLSQEMPQTVFDEMADKYMGLYAPWPSQAGPMCPKPAYFAVKTVIEMLRGTTYVESIDLGRRIYGLVFRRGEQAMVAVWSLDEGVTLVLADASMIQSATSMMGAPTWIDRGRIALSGRPIYLKTDAAHCRALTEQLVSAEVEGQKCTKLALRLNTQQTKVGSPVIDLVVSNVGRKPVTPSAIHIESLSPWTPKMDTVVSSKPLDAGKEQVFPIAFSGPTGDAPMVSMNVQAYMHLQSTVYSDEQQMRYMIAKRRPEVFRADGVLDEWKDALPIDIGADASQRYVADWAGVNDLSARAAIAWDEAAMYIAVRVHDDVHRQSCASATVDTLWLGDSIQLAMDTAGDATASSNVPQYDTTNDIELGVSKADSGQVLDYFWVQPKRDPGPARLSKCAVLRDEKTHTTVYELAIPWSTLGVKGSPKGRWMGVNILINEDDGRGRRGWIEWMPGMGTMKDPSRFAKVLFD